MPLLEWAEMGTFFKIQVYTYPTRDKIPIKNVAKNVIVWWSDKMVAIALNRLFRVNLLRIW